MCDINRKLRHRIRPSSNDRRKRNTFRLFLLRRKRPTSRSKSGGEHGPSPEGARFDGSAIGGLSGGSNRAEFRIMSEECGKLRKLRGHAFSPISENPVVTSSGRGLPAAQATGISLSFGSSGFDAAAAFANAVPVAPQGAGFRAFCAGRLADRCAAISPFRDGPPSLLAYHNFSALRRVGWG